MRSFRFVAAFALVGLLLVSCVPVPVPEPSPAAPASSAGATAVPAPASSGGAGTGPVTESDIVGIVWQWADMIETVPARQSVVPNPEDYTITFLKNGTVDIQADCNKVGGTYTLDGSSLKITAGPSTMAFCGEDSLDQIYLGSLAKVNSAEMESGRLLLLFANDGGRMGFNNGGAPKAGGGSAPPAATRADIINVVWQWVGMTETVPASQSVVPDPEYYTITFTAAGQAAIKADCNMISANYTLDGDSLTIQTGPSASTMAYCGEQSLDKTFIVSLARVASARVDGDRLLLAFANDAGQMEFVNGGPAEGSRGAAPAPEMIQPQQVTLDTQGLPYSWQTNLVPATPYNANEAPGPTGLPEHIQINFGVINPGDRKPGDPIMYLIPVAAYEEMWDKAGNSYVTTTMDNIYRWTIALQMPPPTSGMPALPTEMITGVNDVAAQIGRAAAGASSASKSGYRFVGRWAQDANPVTSNQPLWYTYQGFTNDGRYLVSFFYPVTTAKLPKQADLSAEEMARFNFDPQAYMKAQTDMLNTLAPADWQPDLTDLDNLVGSLQIEGMPATGLHGTLWQWLGTKEKPLDNPRQYEVIYGTDGSLSVKADCNMASGTYTYDGGMVGSVRVTMGPTTLAACAPESRSQELIQSLMAAQDYRVQPSGNELQLNMPAGGPVLRFQNAGPAPE